MAHANEHAATNHAHPKPKFFWKVAAWLTVITFVEVWVFYIEALAPLLAPILLILSAGKFIMVVGYFMHLKWDARAYTGFFTFGMLMALGVYFLMLWMSGPAEAAASLSGV